MNLKQHAHQHLHAQLNSDALATLVLDARKRTHDLLDDLTDEQWNGPYVATVNPPLWEIGHIAFFYESFVLGELGLREPLIANGAHMFNSFVVEHRQRWELPLPRREQMLDYTRSVQARIVDNIAGRDPSALETYLYLLAVYHEDMHGEAFIYNRQTHGYAAPKLGDAASRSRVHADAEPCPGDVAIAGGTFVLGAAPDAPFVYDNEKWGYEVDVPPFTMARAPTTNAEFAAFVESGGYDAEAFWDFEGWRWRNAQQAQHPIYWRRDDGDWMMRNFDQWQSLRPHAPVTFICWYEAQAYCRWAKRRLPTEIEWEFAASASPTENCGNGKLKSVYPWGDESPSTLR